MARGVHGIVRAKETSIFMDIFLNRSLLSNINETIKFLNTVLSEAVTDFHV